MLGFILQPNLQERDDLTMACCPVRWWRSRRGRSSSPDPDTRCDLQSITTNNRCGLWGDCTSRNPCLESRWAGLPASVRDGGQCRDCDERRDSVAVLAKTNTTVEALSTQGNRDNLSGKQMKLPQDSGATQSDKGYKIVINERAFMSDIKHIFNIKLP